MCVALIKKILTGCGAIDVNIDGGLSTESLSLIYGEPEMGKTTLTMQCAMNCAMQGYKTLFIDCDGTFSPQRLFQIASGKFEEIAELIILIRPNDFREQGVVIDHLADYVTGNFGLIVIDTVTSLYRVKVAESSGKAFGLNRELNRQMALLAQIAKTLKIAALVTSQVRSVFNETYVSVEPVATRVLKFWADIIIAMRPTESPQVVKAVLEKSPKQRQPIICHLKIGETGIHDYMLH